MPNNNISPECKKIVDIIDAAFSKAREMMSVSGQRSLIAEGQLSQYQRTQEQRMKEAYQTGRNSVLQGSNTDSNPEGGPKLVLNTN